MELLPIIIVFIFGLVIYSIVERVIHDIDVRLKYERIVIDLLRGIADKLEVDKTYYPKVHPNTGELKLGDSGKKSLTKPSIKSSTSASDIQ